MSEHEIDDLIRELQNNSVELYSFVSENAEDLTDDEIDNLVDDFGGDPLSLREFVVNVLGG